MSKLRKRLSFVLLSFTLFIVIVSFFLLKPFRFTSYKSQIFYSSSLHTIDTTTALLSNSDSVITCGWNKTNLIPPFKTCIAIDNQRNGKHFEDISDSIFVKSIVFKQGNVKVAYVSLDLLICPPEVQKMLDTMLLEIGYSNHNTFLTATHTHSSIGSWHNSFVGEIFAGKYDKRIPLHICSKIRESISIAEKETLPFSFGYFQVPTKKLVYNRLIVGGIVDSMIRGIKIKRADSTMGLLYNFSAHATCLHGKEMNLSGDWPGIASEQFDSLCDFSIFSAGAVGSHGPYRSKTNPKKECLYLASGVYQSIKSVWDTITLTQPTRLYRHYSPISLREPHFRVNQFLILRPWIFKKLFGNENVYISSFGLNDCIFLGLPCDFSGELYSPLSVYASQKSLRLMITSFNGGFIGYITHDDRYSMNSYETRTMNWFGPQNGAYFSDLIKKELDVANREFERTHPNNH